MKRFEYRITKHSANTFNDLVYFCSEPGECSLDQVPHGQTDLLEKILNDEGDSGWELVQVAFGSNGIIVFWKKALAV